MYKLIQKYEGRYHDIFTGQWSTYQSAKDCLHWQHKIEGEAIVDVDKVQLACVPAERLQEFLTNPAARPAEITVTDLPVMEGWAWWFGMGMATLITISLTAVVFWGTMKLVDWLRG